MILYKNGKIIDTNETTRREPNKEEIKEILENLDDGELLTIHNDINDYDYIYFMDDFNEICGNMEADELARKIFYGDFNPNHNYFKFNGYENLQSFDYLEDEIDFDYLAEYIAENEEAFYINDLEDYFDSLEETEEE